MKEIKQETNRPKGNLPYQDVNRPFRMQFVIPGPGITIEQDKNGVLYISAQGGASVSDIIAGDNIEIEHREDGSVVISAVNSVTNITAGENVTITVDPETGASVINSIIGGETNEHYKGVFDTTEDLIAADPDPEIGDYGLIKSLTITDGETSWSGKYKYCFFINGAWTVVDQMLTFTKNIDLLQQYYSVGGSSPVIYLHEIARTGDFWDLRNIPIVATPEVTVDGTTVTVTCATEGAEIWYSTDGSMPHVNGTKYTGPITATGATTYRFVGIKNGMINSLEAVASADYELQAPVIELDWHTGEITMTNPNEDGNGDQVGTIYYTTDGTTPTNESTAYAGPFVIDRSTRFKAIVISGANSSSITNAVFVQSVFANMYGQLQSTTGDFQVVFSGIGNGTSADEIHYTTDGSDPDYQSDSYSSPITFPYFGHTVLKYRGYTIGRVPSAVVSHEYGIGDPEPPVISFNAESSSVTLSLPSSIASLKKYCNIYYTLDGSTPTDQSTLYTDPFQISGNMTVKAVLVAYGKYYSDVATQEITLLDAPAFSLNSNTGALTMTNPNGAGTIYYTLDGSTPTSESNPYSAPVMLTATKTVKAIVISEAGSSPVAEQTFTKAAAPKINNGNVQILNNLNMLTGKYTVTMQTQQQGGTTRYTSDDGGQVPSDPTYQSPAYADAISVGFYDAVTFKARTFAEGFIPSSFTSQSFGITEVHTPEIAYDDENGVVTFERQWITANIPLQTNNNTPELGCRIWYTLDGTNPSSGAGLLWDGNPVAVNAGDTVKAVLVCYGQYDSEVATYNVPGGMEYMYLEAAQANSTVSMVSTLDTAPDLEYSTDGVTWQEWQHTTADGTHTFETITLGAVGDKVYFRGDNPNGMAFLQEGSQITNSSNFVLTGAINGGGNVMSLLDKTMAMTEVPQFGFIGLFSITGPGLEPALLTPPSMDTINAIGDYGCISMYEGCTSLTSAADMPLLTTIGDVGCNYMYSDCTSIASAAAMPLLTSIGDYGCGNMYYGCTSLTSAADMPILTTIGDEGCGGMYSGCTSLTSASDMPALTTIGNEGCGLMYQDCTFDMSEDGITLNFDFPTPPVTAGETTYATAYDVAEWMGNKNGFAPK